MSTPLPSSYDATARAVDVKRRYEDELMRKPNVVGVGVGLRQVGGQSTGDVAVVVMVTHKTPPWELAPGDVIPAQLEGVPVDVQVTGEIQAW